MLGGAVLKQIPVGVDVPASPSHGRPTGAVQQNGHLRMGCEMAAKGCWWPRVWELGRGILWRSGHTARSLSGDMAATRHLQTAPPRTGSGGYWLP